MLPADKEIMRGRYKKEKIALAVQLGIFWLIPLIMLKSGPIFMVLLMLWASFVLSLWLCMAATGRIKYLFPLAVVVLFLPTVPVYYNSSALVHAVWYFVISCGAFIMGTVINAAWNHIKKRRQSRQ